MPKKKFLKPVSVLAAALMASTGSTNVQTNTTQQEVVDGNISLTKEFAVSSQKEFIISPS